jgi:hypothetical protein
MAIINIKNKSSISYYTCEEQKEKFIGDPPPLDRGYRPQPKELALVQILL